MQTTQPARGRIGSYLLNELKTMKANTIQAFKNAKNWTLSKIIDTYKKAQEEPIRSRLESACIKGVILAGLVATGVSCYQDRIYSHHTFEKQSSKQTQGKSDAAKNGWFRLERYAVDIDLRTGEIDPKSIKKIQKRLTAQKTKMNEVFPKLPDDYENLLRNYVSAVEREDSQDILKHVKEIMKNQSKIQRTIDAIVNK